MHCQTGAHMITVPMTNVVPLQIEQRWFSDCSQALQSLFLVLHCVHTSCQTACSANNHNSCPSDDHGSAGNHRRQVLMWWLCLIMLAAAY